MAIALALWAGVEPARAGTTVRSKSPTGAPGFAANISHPAGVNPSTIVFSRALASSWSDQLLVTELRETTDYDIQLMATTTQTYDGINYRQMDRSFTYGSNAPQLSHLDIYNTDNIPAGLSHSSDQAHWTGHLERTRLFDLFGTVIASTDTASFGLDRIRSGDGNIFDYNADPFNPPIVFSSYSIPESLSLTGEAAKAKIAEWSDSHLVIDIYHDFNFPETLTSREYSFSSSAASSPKTALALARDWGARTLFADLPALAFDDSDDPVAFVLSPTASRKVVEKIQYKIARGPDAPPAVTWIELFTPKDATKESSVVVRTWILDAADAESPIYTIDPLGIDPADDQAQSRRPDEDGRWELVFLEPSASVDTNHDGTITSDGTDAASADQPYFHAPNFNHDGGNVATDGEDGIVNGAADLADFFPVFLDLKKILAFLPPGAGVTYKLKQADNALNFVYTNLTRATAFGYLTDNSGSGYGPSLGQPAMSASTIPITSAGVDIFGGPAGSPAFLEAIQNHDGGVLLIEGRTFTSQPLVLEVSQAGQIIMQFTLFAKISLGEIAVDANRDGVIKFASEDSSDATTAAKPYRFWVNSDDDRIVDSSVPLLYDEIEQDDRDVAEETQQNWRSDTISCERDLEDFGRLWLNTKGLVASLKTGETKLGLRWIDAPGFPLPSIKLFPAADPDGGTGYLFEPSLANSQIKPFDTGNYGLAISLAPSDGSGDVTVIGGNDYYVLPPSFLTHVADDAPVVHLLYEGCKPGTAQLQLLLLNRNNKVIGEGGSVWVSLSQPNQFVERFTCGEDSGIGGQVAENVSIHPLSCPEFNPPTNDSEKDYILYVHGYNMLPFEKQRWLETTFKRLYWLGYKGRVGGFSWPCTSGLVGQAFLDVSEERAWESGVRLEEHLENLLARGYRVHLFAHSQGNVVAGEALRSWRGAGNNAPIVETYIASQAAIPSGSYFPDAPRMENYDQTISATGALVMREPLPPDVTMRYWRAGDDSRFPDLWPSSNVSYLSETVISSAAKRWVNLLNGADYALTGSSLNHPGWEINQREKPDQWLTEALLFSYSYTQTSGFKRSIDFLNTSLVWHNLVFPDDRYAVFSHGAGAWTVALGTTPTGGVFDHVVDLQTTDRLSREQQFGTQHLWHSGQFRSFNAVRFQYWSIFLKEAGLPSIR